MTVLNCKSDSIPDGAVFIGRPSKWGNPFAITKQRSRDDVIRLHREWLFGQPKMIESVRRELRGKDLVCFCAPLACHGDTLNEVANSGALNMAQNHSEDFLTPVLRLVQGSPLEPQTKDLTTGQPLTIKTGTNAGQTTQKYFIACAGRKGDPTVEALKAQFERVARAAFPQFFPNGGPCTNPNFSWKIIDGDGFDQNGQPNNTKEGFAGHWVFRFASSYAPRCFVAGKYRPGEQITDPKVFPRGHFVRVAGSITDNIPSNKPGLYANLNMVEWAAIGDVIVSGPDAASVFGGGAAPRPAAAPAPAPHPGAAPAPAPAAGPIYTMTAAANGLTREAYHASQWTDAMLIERGMMTVTHPAPAPAPAPAPQAVAPHPGILAPAPLAHGGSAPTPAAPAPIAAAAPGFKMTDPAGPTYAAYQAQGWTDAALIQNNIMVPA